MFIFDAGRGSAQIMLTKAVKSEVALESELTHQFFIIRYSVADRLLDFRGLL